MSTIERFHCTHIFLSSTSSHADFTFQPHANYKVSSSSQFCHVTSQFGVHRSKWIGVLVMGLGRVN